ncbi:hypothetical protein MASR2M117_02760 [Paludibacter sp.]
MGYYLDLYFRDEARQPKPKELETLFCEHGCKKWKTIFKDGHDLDDYVQVDYYNEEYDVSMLIHFMDRDKYPQAKYFADVRLSWATSYDEFIKVVKSLMVLGDIFDFYIHDGQIESEITLDNVNLVADKFKGVSKNIIGLIGKCEPQE